MRLGLCPGGGGLGPGKRGFRRMAGPKKPYAVAPHGQAFGPRHVVSHRKSKFFGKMGKCRLPNCRLVAAFHFDDEPSPRFCSMQPLIKKH